MTTPTPAPEREALISMLLRFCGIPHAGEADAYYRAAAKEADRYLASRPSPVVTAGVREEDVYQLLLDFVGVEDREGPTALQDAAARAAAKIFMRKFALAGLEGRKDG